MKNKLSMLCYEILKFYKSKYLVYLGYLFNYNYIILITTLFLLFNY